MDLRAASQCRMRARHRQFPLRAIRHFPNLPQSVEDFSCAHFSRQPAGPGARLSSRRHRTLMNQCFIISLPRSGSTLLQRLLAAHPRIKTAGEPWLALPFAYALREKGARAEFSHRSMAQGIGEFVKALPGGTATYYREAGRMMERLHETMATTGRDWFLDKTPRYFLILEELVEMFPEAKFIVLQRSPLAVVASILNTWHEGRFNF